MSDEKTPFHNPFAALKPLRDAMPDATPVAPPRPAEPARPDRASPPGARTAAGAFSRPTARTSAGAAARHVASAGLPPGVKAVPRAVVRMERSGRGGKEVTVIDHLDLPAAEREVWLKALKSGLGCGGVVEGNTLVLQGDQRTRVPALLTARGVRKITVA